MIKRNKSNDHFGFETKVRPLVASVTVCHSSHEAIISWVEAWPLDLGIANSGMAIDSIVPSVPQHRNITCVPHTGRV